MRCQRKNKHRIAYKSCNFRCRIASFRSAESISYICPFFVHYFLLFYYFCLSSCFHFIFWVLLSFCLFGLFNVKLFISLLLTGILFSSTGTRQTLLSVCVSVFPKLMLHYGHIIHEICHTLYLIIHHVSCIMFPTSCFLHHV